MGSGRPVFVHVNGEKKRLAWVVRYQLQVLLWALLQPTCPQKDAYVLAISESYEACEIERACRTHKVPYAEIRAFFEK